MTAVIYGSKYGSTKQYAEWIAEELKADVFDVKGSSIDVIEKYDNIFKEAISNDLNTSSMITVLYDLLKDEEVNDKTKRNLIEKFDEVLSLDLLKTEEFEIDSDLEKEVNELIAKRAEAKKNKDFALADQIRDELLSRNIKLIDTREGTKLEIIKD